MGCISKEVVSFKVNTYHNSTKIIIRACCVYCANWNRYIGRSDFPKVGNAQNDWNFNSGKNRQIDVLIDVFVRFQDKNWLRSLESKCNVFVRLPVSCAQFFLGTEKKHDNGINLIHYDNICSHAYGEVVLCFTHWTQDSPKPFYILTW